MRIQMTRPKTASARIMRWSSFTWKKQPLELLFSAHGSDEKMSCWKMLLKKELDMISKIRMDFDKNGLKT